MLVGRAPLVPQQSNVPVSTDHSHPLASISSPTTIDEEENLPPRGTASQLAKKYLFQTKKGSGGGPRGAGFGNTSFSLSKAFSESLRPATSNAAQTSSLLELSADAADDTASELSGDRSFPSPISPRRSPQRCADGSNASQSSSDSSDFAVHLTDLTFNGNPDSEGEDEERSLHFSALNDNNELAESGDQHLHEYRKSVKQDDVGIEKDGDVLDVIDASFENGPSEYELSDPRDTKKDTVELTAQSSVGSRRSQARSINEVPLVSRSGYVPLQVDGTAPTYSLVELDGVEGRDASLQAIDEHGAPADDPPSTIALSSKPSLESGREHLNEARNELAWLRMELASVQELSQKHMAAAQTLKQQCLEAEEAYRAAHQEADAFKQKWHAAENQIKLAERASVNEVHRLSSELKRMREELHAKDEKIQALTQSRGAVSEEDASAMAEMIELLGLEKEELTQALHLEKAKTFRNEADFRMFERKIRSLQDQNNRLHAESERLRIDLRRLQYEGQTSSAPSDADGFYKNRLEEALLDNESLRALLESSGARIDPSSQPRFPSAAPSVRPTENGQVYPFLDANASTRRPPLTPQTSTLHRAKSFTAWGSETLPAPPSQYQAGDRAAFDRKFKDYEQPTTPRSTTPATSTTPAAMTPAAMRVVRGSSSALSPDNPFSSARDHRTTAGWPDSTASSPSRRRARPLSEQQQPSASTSPGVRSFSHPNASAISFGPPAHQQTAEYASLRDQLNDELAALTARKASLASEMSRIPISGGTGRVRQRKEEIDAELDQVTQMMSTVRRRMRETGVL
ncbi:hypothetical protein HDU86_000285 [Geranomyces michiganensis]|nr:hypothetical protein HDU86_000285 [Geranomyces michiganensis]